MKIYCHTRFNLGISVRLEILRVKPRNSIIFGLVVTHMPTHHHKVRIGLTQLGGCLETWILDIPISKSATGQTDKQTHRQTHRRSVCRAALQLEIQRLKILWDHLFLKFITCSLYLHVFGAEPTVNFYLLFELGPTQFFLLLRYYQAACCLNIWLCECVLFVLCVQKNFRLILSKVGG